MKAHLLDCTRLTNTTHHHAFTDLCRWRGHWYCAYREAPTHNIVPKGHLVVQRRAVGTASWEYATTFRHPRGDLRDPRFFATADALYLLCGAYLPHPAYRHLFDGLTTNPETNVLQTHCAYTTDGTTWSRFFVILRPNYWGWRAVAVGKYVAVAAYHTGLAVEGASILLGLSTGLAEPLPMTTIYDGMSSEREGQEFRYPARFPSEPVLWYDAATRFLGCALRTETDTVTFGIGKWFYGTNDWRWHTTDVLCHPSAVLQTPCGLLLAGRQFTREKPRKGFRKTPTVATTTALYEIEGHQCMPLLTLPSRGDTGYCGLTEGEEEGTVMLSYYSQHDVPTGLPGAAVYVATVGIET